MESNPLVFKFIKTAEKINEDHPLFDDAVETTIQKLGLPYSMAMAYRIACRPSLPEDEKQKYIDEMKEHQQAIMKEQEELQRRFLEHLQQMDTVEKEQTKYPEITQVESDPNVVIENVSS